MCQEIHRPNVGSSCDALVPPVRYDFGCNVPNTLKGHEGPSNDSISDEEATVCPDDYHSAVGG